MSLLRALDGTICTAAVSTTVSRPILSFLYPVFGRPNTRREFHKSAVNRPSRLPSPSAESMDSFFIQVLARAGLCSEHRRSFSSLSDILPSGTSYHRTRRKSTLHGGRRLHRSAQARGPFSRVKKFAQTELKALVDYYGIEFDSGPEEKPPDDGLLIWNVGDDHQPWPVKDESHKALIAEIEELLKDEEAPHDTLFDCYKRLPTPGVAYLKKDTIRALLHHLSIVERPDEVSMQRFLSILDDMKDAHIHILRSEWTSAIRFAGRFMGKVSTEQLHSALYLWRDMEKRAGIKGGAVTLNVLFDVAVRAGNYSLAESFLKEMRARKLKIHRHFRVSLIFYFGVMQNGNAVRRAYKELVEAGDVVDTVVMNAVISALIRAGEPAAAEHVFERMKRLHASKSGAKEPPRYWRERRLLGLRLTYDGRNFTESGEKDKHKDLQAEAPIAPDSRTYGLIIRQHAAEAGNIDRVEELIKEMQYNQVPIDGTVYVVILYGFASFGGVRYSSWTREKLEPLWQGYLASVKAGADRTWLSTTAVIAALKAFSKCTDEQRTLQVWEEARLVWDPTPEEREQVLKVLRALVPDHPFFDFN